MTPAVAPGAEVRRRLRPGVDIVVGISVTRMSRRVALTIISEANSMPVALEIHPESRSFRKPRRPQWKSRHGFGTAGGRSSSALDSRDNGEGTASHLARCRLLNLLPTTRS